MAEMVPEMIRFLRITARGIHLPRLDLEERFEGPKGARCRFPTCSLRARA